MKPSSHPATTTIIRLVASPAFLDIPFRIANVTLPAAVGAPARVIGGAALLIASQPTKGTYSPTAVPTPTNDTEMMTLEGRRKKSGS